MSEDDPNESLSLLGTDSSFIVTNNNCSSFILSPRGIWGAKAIYTRWQSFAGTCLLVCMVSMIICHIIYHIIY